MTLASKQFDRRRTSVLCVCAVHRLSRVCRIAISLCLFAATLKAADPKSATVIEHVTVQLEKQPRRELAGEVLVEAADGGLLLREQDGRLWTIEKSQILERSTTEEKFRPYSHDAAARHLKQELGPEFEIISTKHYLICSSAGRQYGQWCGALFERLFTAFQNYWKQRGLEVREPEFPLIAVVLADERQFAEYATKDAGPDAATAKGYYSIGTNRIVLYDLTATKGGSAGSESEITRRLTAAPFNVATVVHEATHQIAFNSGLHTRYADNPLWLTEGMAMYFETPDLNSKSGWKGVGNVNPLRLRQFHDYAKRRPADSLVTLLQTDERFTGAADVAGDAYAEAWALSYFLIRFKKEAYVAYLKKIADKPRLKWEKPEQRLDDFKASFGNDLTKLDADFLKFVRRLSK